MYGHPVFTARIFSVRGHSPLSFLAMLLCIVIFAPQAWAASTGDDGIVPAFLIDRERRSPVGCDGAPSPPPPSLVPSETLRLLAGRAAAQPGSFDAFASANGLAGIPSFYAVVQGTTPQDAANALRSGWCPQLRSAEFTHVGVAKVQGGWAVILAAREPQYVPAYQPDAPLQGGTPVLGGASAPGGAPAQPLPQTPEDRTGVTPLHEETPGPISATGPAGATGGPVVGAPDPADADIPNIAHPEPLLTGPDGRPLPSTYVPPADTGVRVPGVRPGALPEDGGPAPAPMAPVVGVPQAAGAPVEPAESGREPSIAEVEAAAAAVASGAPPADVFVKSPRSLETGDPAPAQPVPPVYTGNGVITATDVEKSGSVGRVPSSLPLAGGGSVDTDLLRRVNEIRGRGYLCGRTNMPAVPPLRENPVVSRTAAAYAADMQARGYFSPVSPDGRRAGNRLNDAGYAWAVLAENLASGTPTAEAALKNWLSNESQCRNIMNPEYTEAGAGEAGGIRVLTLTAPLSGGAMRLE